MATATTNNNELFLNIGTMMSFAELEEELLYRLNNLPSYLPGTMVRIDIGDQRLTSKQVRELEDLLLDHGFYLQDLMSNGPPGREADVPGEEYPFDHMPYYNDTVMICRHLRSGQKLFSEGNVVILGDVNPGAEVIAGGNILIMGSLRGMVHAGAFGDETAMISAYRMNPTQLRIANHITRPPDGESVELSIPELARIRDGKVVIEKLKL
ncbi:MAG: septum site-determining protein MinC [Deltaproteobacteria bacterium]